MVEKLGIGETIKKLNSIPELSDLLETFSMISSDYFDELDESFVGNFSVEYKPILEKLVKDLSDKENDGPVFQLRDTAFDMDGNVLPNHIALHVENNMDGDIRRFYENFNYAKKQLTNN